MTEISVVVPVYNREHLVLAALASLQRQVSVEVEIIVVDDGSTDRTAAVVRELAEKDDRLIVVSVDHRGPAAARNQGIARASGEYLTFLDSDDLCPQGRLRRQIDKLHARPDLVAVVGAILAFHTVDASGEPLPHEIHARHHDAALSSATFRTQTFRSIGPLDETLMFAEDVDFFLRLLEADLPFLIEADIASRYRIHGGNMVRDHAAKQRGYLQAYARSIRRRRAAGRTAPLRSFFPRTYDRDLQFSGSEGGA